jgi:hypothetical protein
MMDIRMYLAMVVRGMNNMSVWENGHLECSSIYTIVVPTEKTI